MSHTIGFGKSQAIRRSSSPREAISHSGARWRRGSPDDQSRSVLRHFKWKGCAKPRGCLTVYLPPPQARYDENWQTQTWKRHNASLRCICWSFSRKWTQWRSLLSQNQPARAIRRGSSCPRSVCSTGWSTSTAPEWKDVKMWCHQGCLGASW